MYWHATTLGIAALAGTSSAAFLPQVLDTIVGDEALGLLPPQIVERPVVNSEELQARISEEALRKRAHELFDAATASNESIGHPTRAIGTPGHLATLEMLYDALWELEDYYTIETQPFVAIGGRVHDWYLKRSSGDEKLSSAPFVLTPGVNLTTAPISFAKDLGCLPADWYGLEGTLAVVPRGECGFGEKSELAGLSGAVGLLVWDPNAENKSDVLTGGTLGTPLEHQVPTLGISSELATSLKEGEELSLFVDAEISTIETVNVIAETKEGDHDNVVFLGGHSDSVPVGPGLNDNGSGLISLLEIAKQLTHFKVNNAVRFAWWSAEEIGLKGSLHYTNNLMKHEAAKIRLFLDFDMLASPNYAFEIYDSDDKDNPTGSSALRDLLEGWYIDHGYNYTTQPFDGRSDYVGFIEIGIPSSGLDAGAEELKTHDDVLHFGGTEGEPYDVCYHQKCDGLDNLNYDAWLANTKATAHAAAVYAKSLEGFPLHSTEFYERREPLPRKWSQNLLS